MRHTKIIATVGPASDSDAALDALIAAGVDIFRLNFSHGTHQSHGATIARVRRAAGRARREVAILQDLGGPKIRTGSLEGGRPPHVKPGDTLPLTTALGLADDRVEHLDRASREPADRRLAGQHDRVNAVGDPAAVRAQATRARGAAIVLIGSNPDLRRHDANYLKIQRL